MSLDLSRYQTDRAVDLHRLAVDSLSAEEENTLEDIISHARSQAMNGQHLLVKTLDTDDIKGTKIPAALEQLGYEVSMKDSTIHEAGTIVALTLKW